MNEIASIITEALTRQIIHEAATKKGIIITEEEARAAIVENFNSDKVQTYIRTGLEFMADPEGTISRLQAGGAQ